MYFRETMQDNLEITTSSFWYTKIWATIVHKAIGFSVVLRNVTWQLLLQAMVGKLRPKFCANTNLLVFKYKPQKPAVDISPLSGFFSGLQLRFLQAASVQAHRENRSYMTKRNISLFEYVGFAANTQKLPCSHILHRWLS